uniref:DNA-directed RNA polymerase III subunit RPC7-like isoform X1 n=1 Tax=Myxine glutinosa TaxID=7769 RepID=UPI00358E2B33
MAGMGRGRGRGQMTFNIEAIGFGKGEALPPTALQPPPLFPLRQNLPLPLQTGEETDYQVALKQEFRLAMKCLPYFLKIEMKKKDIVRYSDKYHSKGAGDLASEWVPDWRRLPKELNISQKSRKAKKVKLKGVDDKMVKKVKSVDKTEILKTLESLEKMEGEGEQNEEISGKKGEEQEDEEEEDKEGEDIEAEYEEELEEGGLTPLCATGRRES